MGDLIVKATMIVGCFAGTASIILGAQASFDAVSFVSVMIVGVFWMFFFAVFVADTIQSIKKSNRREEIRDAVEGRR